MVRSSTQGRGGRCCSIAAGTECGFRDHAGHERMELAGLDVVLDLNDIYAKTDGLPV